MIACANVNEVNVSTPFKCTVYCSSSRYVRSTNIRVFKHIEKDRQNFLFSLVEKGPETNLESASVCGNDDGGGRVE